MGRNCLTAGTVLTTVGISEPLLKRLRRCPTTEVLFASVFVMKTVEILFLKNACASFICLSKNVIDRSRGLFRSRAFGRFFTEEVVLF